MTKSKETSSAERPHALYCHEKRGEWGVAILAWDRDGRRAYQFEDGKLRVFANGFQALMTPVDRPVDEARGLTSRLLVALAANDASAAKAKRPNASASPIVGLEDQVALFRTLYERGFADPAWRHDMRGIGAKRRIKRHRDAAIAAAAEVLDAERLAALMTQQQFGTIHADVVGVLQATDLVTPAQVRPVARIEAKDHQAFARAVRDLVHGDGVTDRRLDRFVDALMGMLGAAPSWQLSTVLLALAHPKDHICVRPAIARHQAASMAPNLEVKTAPSGTVYERLVAMAKAITQELEKHDLVARDLMDIHDFMQVTLSPKALSQLEALRRERAAEGDLEDANAA